MMVLTFQSFLISNLSYPSIWGTGIIIIGFDLRGYEKSPLITDAVFRTIRSQIFCLWPTRLCSIHHTMRDLSGKNSHHMAVKALGDSEQGNRVSSLQESRGSLCHSKGES